jgi:hypothetical protein
MQFGKFVKTIQIAAFGVAVAFAASDTAHADVISVSYLGAGVQAPTSTTNIESFNGITSGSNTTFTTTFAGSGITGTYAGTFNFSGANQYGGAGGSGQYITTPNIINSSYTLTLSSGVNFFGYWLSALDMGNQVQFYNNSTLLFTYTPQDLIAALGACTTSGGYCGNPNDGYQNSAQQYAYLEFYDNSATFNKVVFTETIANAGYESDNHSVALLDAAPGGTVLGTSPVPEPSSIALFGTGMIGLVGAARRRFKA